MHDMEELPDIITNLFICFLGFILLFGLFMASLYIMDRIAIRRKREQERALQTPEIIKLEKHWRKQAAGSH